MVINAELYHWLMGWKWTVECSALDGSCILPLPRLKNIMEVGWKEGKRKEKAVMGDCLLVRRGSCTDELTATV